MPLEFQHMYSLAGHNSLGVPAVCDSYIEINDSSQLTQVIEHASQNKLSIFILGEGTNLVLSQNITDLVVKANILGRNVIEEDNEQVRLRIGAGENWHDLVTWTLEQGYFGLENLALIPGSCGAAPVQNIGAYGVDISRTITTVEYIDLVARISNRLSHQECQFGYRDSIFKHDLENRSLITHIELCLPKKAAVNKSYPALAEYLEQHSLPDTPQSIYQAVCDVRQSKLPDVKEVPNVGSFFKNPIISKDEYEALLKRHPELPGYSRSQPHPEDDEEIKVPAAWLIDYLGWKGKLKGGVGVHSKQALVVINPGHCSGQRILAFVERITKSVKKEFGISLEIEPRIVGD